MGAAPSIDAALGMPPQMLVVDDVPMFRELERLFLSRLGCVHTAATAADALDAAGAHRPEVILLDTHLPDRDGGSIVAELRERVGNDVAIIMVTSGRSVEYAEAIAAGADDVLTKPLSRTMLVRAVTRFIGQPSQPRGLPRVEHRIPVETRGEARSATGRILNLSRGGLSIEADWTEPEGSELQVAFDLPGAPQPIESTVRIVWREAADASEGAHRMGVRFTDLDRTTWAELDEFVNERVPWERPPYRRN